DGVTINVHQPWLALDCFPLTREFVKRNTGVFDGGDHRRSLIKIAAKFLKRGANGFFVESRYFALLDDFTLLILCARCDSEHHGSGIFLVLRHEQILNFCTASEGEQQDAGGDRIESAAVTYVPV